VEVGQKAKQAAGRRRLFFSHALNSKTAIAELFLKNLA
jgi:hypothetical protein